MDEALGETTPSKKLRKIDDEDLLDVLDKAHIAIILSFLDGVLRDVRNEKTAASL